MIHRIGTPLLATMAVLILGCGKEKAIQPPPPPTVLIKVSVDRKGRVRDARAIPSSPEPTAAEMVLAVERVVKQVRFSGLKNNGTHEFVVPVTIHTLFGQPTEP